MNCRTNALNTTPAGSPAGAAMVEAGGLVMRYGAKTVVDHVSFSLHTGSTVGFLGPNGAGKSTTMRILAGFRIPSAGTVTIAGHDMRTERRRAQAAVGYLPEAVAGFGHLTAVEFLTWCCEARGLRGSDCAHAIGRVCDELALAPVMATGMRRLSKGWRQRVWLAQALLHAPEVLILDEPTEGLDPVQKLGMRSLIKRLAATRVVVFSTHILEEAEEICDRAIIIDRGRILADDEVKNLLDEKGRLAPRFHALLAGSS